MEPSGAECPFLKSGLLVRWLIAMLRSRGVYRTRAGHGCRGSHRILEAQSIAKLTLLKHLRNKGRKWKSLAASPSPRVRYTHFFLPGLLGSNETIKSPGCF